MDILEFAINMEKEGYKYYTEQAEANKDNGLYEVFIKLAGDEDKHAKLIADMKDGKQYSPDETQESEAENIFSDKAQKISEIAVNPEQLDVYRFALDKEEESIELYKELMQKSEGDKKAYSFLIEEETKHYKVVSNIVALLENPKQWVESAEFGVREDY